MKKVLSLALAAVMLAGMMFVLSSCDNNSDAPQKLVVGVTVFEPMNFRDSAGNWTGFDTEFAQAVAAKLGMEAEFQEITWSQKFVELQSGAIDVIWNGMTANAIDRATNRPRHEDVDFTYSYMLNHQAAVIRVANAAQFSSRADFNGKAAAAEKGSSGEPVALDLIGSGGTMIDVVSQIETFIEVKSGAVDFAVVDSILAHRVTGSGDYSDLMIANVHLGSKQEVYAIGLPKGSELVGRINAAITELYNDGTLRSIAEKYGLEDSLVISTAATTTLVH